MGSSPNSALEQAKARLPSQMDPDANVVRSEQSESEDAESKAGRPGRQAA